jgi:hypothetical protein
LPFLLEKMYYESGFITDTGEPVSLYKGCKFADKCWAGIDERKPDNEEVKWSYLSFPWIGEKYYKNKILILGINTYEGGGFEYNTQIITEARAELEEGKKRINFGYVFPKIAMFRSLATFLSSAYTACLQGTSNMLEPFLPSSFFTIRSGRSWLLFSARPIGMSIM